MNHTEELRNQRAGLVAKWREILDKAGAEKRALSAEEVEQSNKIEADIDAIAKTVEAREKADAIDRATVPDSQRVGKQTATATPQDAEARASAAFWGAMRDNLTAEQRADLKVGTDSAGGYTVPDAFRKELVQALIEENVIRGLATVFSTTSGVLSIPVVSTHGSAAWKAEEVAYATSDEVFSEVTLNAYKGTSLIKVSEELLHDSAFPLESYLAKEFGRRLGKLEEEAFINGDGSGKPTGVVVGSTLGTTATATNAVTVDELTDLFYSLGRAYRGRASWVMKDSTVKLVRKLKTGVSSDNTYLWQAGLREGEPDSLLGRPVFVSEFMPAATTGLKPVIFGDISYYYIGDRQAITMQRLVELYAGNGHVGFRQFKRTDGKLSLATAVNHLIMA